MSATILESAGSDLPQNTLGKLLYADTGRRRTPEADWTALVRAMASGDTRALDLLFQRTHRLVFTLALRITGSRELAEEITVDVFHDIWRRSAAYRDEGSVVGWIMNQARSRAIDRVRFETHAKRTMPAGHDIAEAAPEPLADPIDARNRSQQLRRAVAVLAEGERRAIEVAYFADMSHAEAAVHLGEPVGTVKTRIRTGLQKLRRMMDADRGRP